MKDSAVSPLPLLEQFLRFPSVSTDPQFASHVLQCAEWLVQLLEQHGFDAVLYPTKGHPLVIAKTKPDPQKKTVLIYGHYDVQPPDPLEEWITPPFEPRIEEAEGKIYARGSADNKGQIMAHLMAAFQLLDEEGELPVNLIFLIEGEEEIGSPHLVAFLAENKELLRCDTLLISDTAMGPGNRPMITYGLRGVAGMEVTILGPARDLHSGLFGGTVANPLTIAGHLIASLHHIDGSVAIDHFYEAVREIPDWEKKLTQELAAVTSPEDSFTTLAGVTELFGEPQFTPYERVGARPALDINGFGGGYQGEGTKTVLPAKAFFKLTVRLVPDQDPGTILTLIEEHLNKEAAKWPGIEIKIERGHAGPPYLANPRSEEATAATEAIKAVFGEAPLFSRDGGTLPILSCFQEVLGKDPLLIGLANPDAQVHSPNENLLISNYFQGIEVSKMLLKTLS